MHHGNPYYGVMFEAVRELHHEMMPHQEMTPHQELTSHDELLPEHTVSVQPKALGLLRRVTSALWQRKPGFEVGAPAGTHISADDACAPLVCQPVTTHE